MPRISLLIIVMCLFSSAVFSQTLLQGQVFENKTRIPLAGIRVEDMNNKQQVVTDNKGRFSLKAAVNDLLVLKGFAYENDTLLVTDLRPKEIFMLPQQHMLKDVKVSTFDGPSMAVYNPNFHGQAMNYQTDANGNYKGGVNLRFWYWKKAERKRARQQKLEQDAIVQQQIDKAFSTANIAQYIPLNGAEMDRFIFIYKPSVRVYQANDFNLVAYLNSCYQKFMKLPAEKRQMQLGDTLKAEN